MNGYSCNDVFDVTNAVYYINKMNADTISMAEDRIVMRCFNGPLTDLRNAESVADRIVAVDRLWRTNLSMDTGAVVKIAENIVQYADVLIELLGNLEADDLEKRPSQIIQTAERVMPIILDASSRKHYSFATKFFHWCTRVHFPIVDSYARTQIRIMQSKIKVPRERLIPSASHCGDYSKWVEFYSYLIKNLGHDKRELLFKADYRSQPGDCKISNSLLRILDKVFYMRGSVST
ncbi:MAG: hypothetical protein ACP5O7_05830 [Phycisphaerae bacterium]